MEQARKIQFTCIYRFVLQELNTSPPPPAFEIHRSVVVVSGILSLPVASLERVQMSRLNCFDVRNQSAIAGTTVLFLAAFMLCG